MTTTESRIVGLIAEHLGAYVEEQPNGIECSFADLGADSLDLVELVMAIEDEFGVELTDDELDGFAPDLPKPRPISDLVRLVDEKLAGKAQQHDHRPDQAPATRLGQREAARHGPHQLRRKTARKGRGPRGGIVREGAVGRYLGHAPRDQQAAE